ncbi:MAG: putative DNA repair protein MutK [Myxococcota bacterium]|jgi:predicted DNA repair protein MutK
MPSAGLLALLDDVAAIADDVATLTISATQKSAGLVTDDMAVTAEQTLGFAREREIPVVLKVARGSLINKTIILAPAALFLNAVAPWVITPILMCGGLFLAYEGVHKVIHTFSHDHADDHDDVPSNQAKIVEKDGKKVVTASKGAKDLVQFETQRVKGAIRTDLILSAEIVALTLSQVAEETFLMQVLVLYAVCIIITIGVFGIVGGLVKIDDFGEWLAQKGGVKETIGLLIVRAAPILLKVITWVGTVAMLMVGGHILLSSITPAYDWVHHLLEPIQNGVAHYLASAGIDISIGIMVGSILVAIGATGIPQKLWALRPWGEEDPAPAH